MVVHKRFTCEECGVFWKIKSRRIYGGQILCVRCYRSATSFSTINKANKEAAKEWKVKHRKKAYSWTEQQVLYKQHKREGLTDDEIKSRLTQLKDKVLESNKIMKDKEESKPKKTFKEKFTEMVNS